MIETFATAFQEVAKEVPKPKETSDLPYFASKLEPKYISSLEQADKPLAEQDKVHLKTGVPFRENTVELPNGEKYIDVFPVFPHAYEAKLDETQYLDSDNKQFRACNEQLKEAVKHDPELRSKFTDEQIKEIETGETPTGYTWHHHEEPGRMQLVDSEIHAKTGHLGGKALWGGDR